MPGMKRTGWDGMTGVGELQITEIGSGRGGKICLAVNPLGVGRNAHE